jgi:hypothetical protein
MISSTPFALNSLAFWMKPGACCAEQVGVNAPGTAKTTTFLPLDRSVVSTSDMSVRLTVALGTWARCWAGGRAGTATVLTAAPKCRARRAAGLGAWPKRAAAIALTRRPHLVAGLERHGGSPVAGSTVGWGSLDLGLERRSVRIGSYRAAFSN